MKHQPPAYGPRGASGPPQGYPYMGQPMYAAHYAGQPAHYMEGYPPQYPYQRPPPQHEYPRYAERAYCQVNPACQPPVPYAGLQTRPLPPKLKAAARPMAPVQHVYQITPPQPVMVKAPPSEVSEEAQAFEVRSRIQTLMTGNPPPGFDIIGRGGLPGVHFETAQA